MSSDQISLNGFLRELIAGLREFPEWHKAKGDLEQIAESGRHVFTIAVVGRMKAGKSTLINSLIGEELAISGVEEATATVNWIRYGHGEQCRQAIVHYKDGRRESIPLSRLQEWAGKSPEVIEKIRQTAWIDFFAEKEFLKRVQIVDTPGTGSAVEEHEQAARDFLNAEVISLSREEGNKADAIIYVIPPVGRDNDLSTLEEFKSNRLSGSGPYNSVAVLHKWDGLSTGEETAALIAQRKASQLKEQLKGQVLAVLPVSAPLSLASQVVKSESLTRLLEIVHCMESEDLSSLLRLADRWDRDPSRKKAKDDLKLNWNSFKLLILEIRQNNLKEAQEVRELLIELGGMHRLQQLLENHFFAPSEVIKECQLLKRTQPVVQYLHQSFSAKRQNLLETSLLVKNIIEKSKPVLDIRESEWLQKVAIENSKLIARIAAIENSMSLKWVSLDDRLKGLLLDLEVLSYVRDNPRCFSDEPQEVITDVCDYLSNRHGEANLGKRLSLPLDQILKLINDFRAKANMASNRERRILDHIVRRLEQACAAMKEAAF